MGLNDLINDELNKPNSESAILDVGGNMTHLGIVENNGNIRYIVSNELAEICQQYVTRFKHKLSPEKYDEFLLSSSGAGTTPMVGAAWLYQHLNNVSFPDGKYVISANV